MDEGREIEKLKKILDFKFPILSLYLGSAEKRTPYSSFFSSQMHSLIHQNLSERERKFYKKDIEKIDNFLHESFSRENVRSVVFFSSGEHLWEVLTFEFFLPPICLSLHRPYLKPIEEALATYQKYMVILIDRKKARLFTVHLGKIEEFLDIFNGQVPQRVKAKTINLGRTDKIMRHIEYHLNEHLKLIVSKAKEFIVGKDIHFLILGGHKELLSKIKRRLVYPLNKMLLGDFVTELNIPVNQVLRLSKQTASRVKKRELD